MFNTRTKEFEITADLTMVMDDISMQINIVHGTEENCDLIGGTSFFGELVWDMSSDSDESKEATLPMNGRISGAAHCEFHYLEKANEGIAPRFMGAAAIAVVNGDGWEDKYVQANVDGKDADVVHAKVSNEMTSVSNAYHRSSASSDMVAMSTTYADADAKSGRPTVATLVAQINEALPDYPDYELQVSVKDAQLVPGVTIGSAMLHIMSMGEYNTSLGDQPGWAVELSGSLKVSGEDLMSLPLDVDISIAAVAHISKTEATVVGIAARVEIGLDHDMVKISGAASLTPPPFHILSKTSATLKPDGSITFLKGLIVRPDGSFTVLKVGRCRLNPG